MGISGISVTAAAALVVPSLLLFSWFLIIYAFDNAPRHSVEFEKKLISLAELPSFNHGICHFFYMKNHSLARLVSRKDFSLDLTTFRVDHNHHNLLRIGGRSNTAQ